MKLDSSPKPQTGPPAAKSESPEAPEKKIKRLEEENASLRGKLKSAEANLSQKEVDASCKLTKYF